MSIITGRLVEVIVEPRGARVTAAASISDTLLYVDDVTVFDPDGGTFLTDLDATARGYAAVVADGEDVTGHLALSSPMDITVAVDTMITVLTVTGSAAAQSWTALVQFDPDEPPVDCGIPTALTAYFRPGVEQAGLVVDVNSETGEVASQPEQVGGFDGSAIDPATLPDTNPTAPPATSPAIVVKGGLTTFTIVAEDVAASTSIEYHASATSGFTPDSTTLLATTRATVYPALTLPDGSSFALNTTYYFVAIATNSVGSAAPSVEVSAQLDPSGLDDIIAARVQAGIVMAGAIEAGLITLSPDTGLTIPQSVGGTTHLAADGSGNTFAGQGTFDALTTLGNLDIRGLTNTLTGALTLSKGVTDPASMPIITTDYATTDFSDGVIGTRFHLTGAPSGGWATISGSGTTSTLRTYSAAGVAGISAGFGIGAATNPIGLVHVGTKYYALYMYFAPLDGNYHYNVDILNDSDLSAAGTITSILTAGSAGGYPTLGTDGTNLLIARTSASGTLHVITYNTSGALLNDRVGDTAIGSDRPYNVQQVNLGGTNRFVVTTLTKHLVYDITSSSVITRNSGQEWPTASASTRGMWWDGTNLHGMDNGKLFHYTALTGTYDFAYTWYDSDAGGLGTAETKRSPIKTIAPTKRARWTVTLPSAPPDDGTTDGANTARIYVVATGGTLALQTTLTEPALAQTYTTAFATGTGAPPSTSGFDSRTSSSKGAIESAATDGGGPLVSVKGDGAYRLGTLKDTNTDTATSTTSFKIGGIRWVRGTITGPATTASSWTGSVSLPAGAFSATPGVVISSNATGGSVVWSGAATSTTNLSWRAEWNDGGSHSGPSNANYIAIGPA